MRVDELRPLLLSGKRALLMNKRRKVDLKTSELLTIIAALQYYYDSRDDCTKQIIDKLLPKLRDHYYYLDASGFKK